MPGRKGSECKGPEEGTGLAGLRIKRKLGWLKHSALEEGRKRQADVGPCVLG
jgi:hypothetical protein